MADREYEALQRQVGRAAKHHSTNSYAIESSAKLDALRRRVAHKSATFQRMVDMGLLEKELEAR